MLGSWRCKIAVMHLVIGVSQRDELVEGLIKTEILTVRRSKISKLQAIMWREPRVGFAAPLGLQLEFSLVGCHSGLLFYKGKYFGLP